MGSARSIEEINDLANKHFRLYMLMNRWTRLLQDKKTVVDFFVANNYRRIAIYGFNYVGETLERELRDSDICVEYIVDRNAEYMYAQERIITPDEILEEVDALVVTVLDNTYKLTDELKKKYGFKIITIEEVICGV